MIFLIFILFGSFDCTSSNDFINGQDKKCISHGRKNNELDPRVDFNYNEISLVDKKMPFINCNRKLLLKPKTDIADIFLFGDTGMAEKILMNIDKSISIITSILEIMTGILNFKHIIEKESSNSKQKFIETDAVENNNILKCILESLTLLSNNNKVHMTDINEIRKIFHYIDKFFLMILG